MAHYYAPPLSQSHRTRSLRASLLKPVRKRKRREIEEADEDEDASSDIATLTPAEAEQYRVAGCDPGDGLPSKPFPHAPAGPGESKLTPSEIQKELASLKPPIYASGLSSTARISLTSAQPSTSLRQRHLNVMTTLMHNCLLKGDYQRAGRAWGMILRGESSGKSVDVRAHGRWGIGAEILLHRNFLGSSEEDTDALFTEESFRAARDYYERLILQYPWRQTHASSTNSLVFYPAMFGLWIYEVCQTSKARIAALEKSSDAAFSDSEAEVRSESEEYDAQVAAIKARELKLAKEIAQRLDELLTSPPFDKHANLLSLRGMVALWISDLQSRTNAPDQTFGASDTDVSNIEEEIAKEVDPQRQTRLDEARKFFKRSQDNGGRLWDGVSHILNDA